MHRDRSVPARAGHDSAPRPRVLRRTAGRSVLLREQPRASGDRSEPRKRRERAGTARRRPGKADPGGAAMSAEDREAIYTIGHGNRPLEELVSLLESAHV